MKKFNLLLVSFSLFLFLQGCATGEKTAGIDLGMAQDQVIRVLGRPDGKQQKGEYIVYKYSNRLISGWSWDRADYTFIFKDNSLMEYGPGEVREKNVGGIHTLLLL